MTYDLYTEVGFLSCYLCRSIIVMLCHSFVFAWFGLVLFCLVWFGLVCLVWFCLVLFGLVWFGLVMLGFVWFCLVWLGLVWLGFVWFGLVWFNGILDFRAYWTDLMNLEID